MNWSFQIARISGINIKVHISFFLVLLLGGMQWAGVGDNGVQGFLFGAVLMILLFTCVTLHELGHSLVAQRFGIPVHEITLLPLGGVAQLGKNPEKPMQELLIAIAGPLVNVVIAIILLIVTGGATNALNVLGGRGELLNQLNDTSPRTMLYWLLGANVSLFLFNLIPAFPLDGGRVLRALLAMGLGYPRATRIAAIIGQALAIVLGILGFISGNFILILIAVFVFFGASQENTVAQSKTVLTTQKVGDAYNRHALTLQIGDRVSKVVDYILTSYQPDFAVMQGSNLIGIVRREDVLRSLALQTNDAFVTEIMNRDFQRIDAGKSLDEVREFMSEQAVRIVAVFSGNQYLGLVSSDDLTEAFAVLTFAERQKRNRMTKAQS